MVLMGVPYDASSSFARGPAVAPAAIREALASLAGNSWTEGGIDLAGAYDDIGDVQCGDDPAAAREAIEARVRSLGAARRRFLALGGDHSVTYPLVRALALPAGVTVVHVDAHPDLYPDFEGDRYSHACPFARILEEGCAARLVQVGIRASTGVQDEIAARHGIEVITPAMWMRGARPAVAGPVYLSLDLDGLDPAFAPGVSHPEPGGLSTRDIITLVQDLPGPIIGADVVELNPSRDVNGLTARVAAKLVKEILGRMIGDAGG